MEDKQHICMVCGHVHDEEKEGKFDELPKYFNCPECGCAKEEYQLV